MSADKDSSERKITNLDALIEGLSSEERALAGRLFDVIPTTGCLRVPQEMRGFVEKNFGSVGAVQEQKIVRVTDRVTLEGTIDLVGDAAAEYGPEWGAVELGVRPPRPDLHVDPQLPADTRLWALLQHASGGVWGGCVYDVDAIAARLG